MSRSTLQTRMMGYLSGVYGNHQDVLRAVVAKYSFTDSHLDPDEIKSSFEGLGIQDIPLKPGASSAIQESKYWEDAIAFREIESVMES